ncbi:hypothetical protein ACNFJ7_05580 [Sphingomonas sp. HT-1]|uniref:hypothetical protein n=1 Tax=unclassified Sphingomonas TaxID=196159 RepID=UPI000376A21E|nr:MULTISPECIES: hypothetical protein [unclassified Sphingomonas]KTF68951.1 hypothetical protein ATB93_11465 [Sphingomonas sp. WG]
MAMTSMAMLPGRMRSFLFDLLPVHDIHADRLVLHAAACSRCLHDDLRTLRASACASASVGGSSEKQQEMLGFIDPHARKIAFNTTPRSIQIGITGASLGL